MSLGGTAGSTAATVTEIAALDGTTYSVAVGRMASPGTVTASILAGRATDTAGNASAASTSIDNTVAFAPPDPSPPVH